MPQPPPSPAPRLRPESWIFDLDNTLYHPRHRLFDQIDVRMGQFIGARLGLGADAARVLQKRYFREHGTTLTGLMRLHNVPPEEFLEFVHDISLDGLPPDPALAQALAALPGGKYVYTNGSLPHAERVLRRLGCDHCFAGIFDIRAADYRPKPEIAAYRALCERYGVRPERTVMIEDLARNLAPAAELGMHTVWLRHRPGEASEGYVRQVIDDLGAWLESLRSRLTPRRRALLSRRHNLENP